MRARLFLATQPTAGGIQCIGANALTGTRHPQTMAWTRCAPLLLVLLLAVVVMAGCAQPVPAADTTSPALSAPPAPVSTTSSTSAPTRSIATSGPSGSLQVHFIDVGQGDAILIRAADGKVALIDGGESGSGVLSYLRAKGVERINLMIATHPHADHIGGLVDVLEALPVDEVVTNGEPTTTLTYEHFLDGIAAAKAAYKEVKRGDTLTLGGLSFAVLSPEGPGGGDLNDGSIVLRLAYGKVAFLSTGDAQQTAEASMLGAGEPVEAQILKVGHHGSRSSSSPAFLAAVHPEVAVYSAGLGNSYGHPHAETLAALAAVGATVYGTDTNGTVVVTSDGAGYKVEMAKQSQARAPPTVTTGQTPVPAPGPLALAKVSLTSPVSPGATARLTIKTTPGAGCTITVYYKSGASQAAGLGPQNAAGDGTATWQWKVGSRTTPGVWRIVVTATVDGQQTSLEIPLEVG